MSVAIQEISDVEFQASGSNGQGRVSDLAIVISQAKDCAAKIEWHAREGVIWWWKLGMILKPIETVYGQNTMGKVAKAIGQEPSFLYRAREVATKFPDETALLLRMAEIKAMGRKPTITYFIENEIPDKENARPEKIEKTLEFQERKIDNLLALIPPDDPGAARDHLESLKAKSQEMRLYLQSHVDGQAEEEFLASIKLLCCAFCGGQPVDAAHMPKGKGQGGDIVVPVCVKCHREQAHMEGLKPFLTENFDCVLHLLESYGEALLALYQGRGIRT